MPRNNERRRYVGLLMTDKVSAPTLARCIAEHLQLRLGPDQEPWKYEDGVWVNATADVRRLVAEALPEAWKREDPLAVLTYLRDTIPPLPAPDAHERAVNFWNGWVIAGQPEEVYPHPSDPQEALDRVGGHTVQIPWAFADDDFTNTLRNHEVDPHTPFHRFIEATFPGDPEAQAFAWEVVGYFLYPHNPLQVAFLLYGKGANGKSVFLDVLAAILGHKNVTHISLDLLTNNQFAAADLLGKTANFVSEMPAKYLSDSGMLKLLTGGDKIRGEIKRGASFYFYSQAKHAFSVNELFGTADASYGYRRRFVLFPFAHTVAPEHRIPLNELVSALTQEEHVPFILRSAMEGLDRLLKRRHFPVVPSFQEAQQEFYRVTYELTAYMEERLIPDPDHRTKRAALYEDYQKWNGNPRRELNRTKFLAQLREFGFTEKRISGVWYVVGCRIGTPEDALPALPPRATVGIAEGGI
jgi:P4 family phage/plasmid primase-like protien